MTTIISYNIKTLTIFAVSFILLQNLIFFISIWRVYSILNISNIDNPEIQYIDLLSKFSNIDYIKREDSSFYNYLSKAVYNNENILLPFHFFDKTPSNFWMWNNEKIIKWIETSPSEIVASRVHQIYYKNCTKDKIVLDIGSNHGYYGLMAAKYGCSVLLFDPQPMCQSYIAWGILINNLNNTYMVPHGVGIEGETIPIFENSNCEGRFPMNKVEDGINISDTIYIQDPVQDLGKLLKSDTDIWFVKIDTEGHELSILLSLEDFVRKKKIKAIIVELTPIFYSKLNVDENDIIDILHRYMDYGYALYPLLKRGCVKMIEKRDINRSFIRSLYQADILITYDDIVMDNICIEWNS